MILTTEISINAAYMELKFVFLSFSAEYWQSKKNGTENVPAHMHLRSQSSSHSPLSPATKDHTMMQLRTLFITSIMFPWILSSAASNTYMEARKPEVKYLLGVLCIVLNSRWQRCKIVLRGNEIRLRFFSPFTETYCECSRQWYASRQRHIQHNSSKIQW